MKFLSLALFALVFSGLLLFGCVQAPEEGAASPSATVGATVATPSPAASPQASPAATVGASLVGLDYEQLVALGTPVECDVRIDVGNVSQMAKLFIKGSSVRMETVVEQAGMSLTVASVFKDDIAYVSLPKATIPLNTSCEWLYVNKTQVTQPGAASEGDLKSKPAVDFSCKQGSFGDEEFSISGRACSMTEMIQEAMGQV